MRPAIRNPRQGLVDLIEKLESMKNTIAGKGNPREWLIVNYIWIIENVLLLQHIRGETYATGDTFHYVMESGLPDTVDGTSIEEWFNRAYDINSHLRACIFSWGSIDEFRILNDVEYP